MQILPKPPACPKGQNKQENGPYLFFTKLVCTVGPSTNGAAGLEALAVGGMNIARVNMCHDDREWYRGVIRAVRGLNGDNGFAVAIMMDTEGSEIHMGERARRVAVSPGPAARDAEITRL